MCTTTCNTQQRLMELQSDFDTVCEANRSLEQQLKETQKMLQNVSSELCDVRRDRDSFQRNIAHKHKQLTDALEKLKGIEK